MPPFVASPHEPEKKIPVITLGDLIAALRTYLPTVIDIEIGTAFFDWDRSMGGETLLTFRDARNSDWKVLATIYGKAASSLTSRLWAEPFDVSIHPSMPSVRYFSIWVTPLPKRAIEIRKIVRWERGVPYVEAD